ncbi:MAG TPA: zinc-dependent peptidase [Flavobacteriales bacterium]|nr:zinc-dependent peptidase [Flavobacteriales bacterium]
MGVPVIFGLALLLTLWAARSAGFLRGRRPLSAEHRSVLARYAISYQRRMPHERKRMERIVSLFVHDKEWVGAGMVVEEEMKVMIGACAAQLLIGHPDLTLKHFERIVLYPNSYRSPYTGRMNEGEVRPKAGTIVISWEDFLHGYARNADAHNVGLHELAHAIWFENDNDNGEDGFLSPQFLLEWNQLAAAEIARIKAGAPSFFRDYAGVNEAEFFAVAVEYYFEVPLEFRDAQPELYALLCGLLKQDPAAIQVMN